jgi:RIO-like serine/threonine protein kinase
MQFYLNLDAKYQLIGWLSTIAIISLLYLTTESFKNLKELILASYNEVKKEYTGEVTMEHLDALCLADMYTDDPEKIPAEIWEKIRNIVRILYNDEGIEYIDITGYNFIEKDNKIYIIDFGDAKYTKKTEKINWFLEEFLNGYNGWNPDFR